MVMTASKRILSRCTICGGEDFVLRTGNELTCTSCGYVVQENRVDDGASWKTLGPESVRSGEPPNLLMQDRGMSTVIGRGNEDSSGNKITGRARKDLERLRRWQHRITMKNRSLSEALDELRRMGDRLQISSSVLKTASYIYRSAAEKDLIRGRTIKYLTAAAIYAAIRREGIPMTLKEMSSALDLDKNELSKNYRILVSELRIKMPTSDPATFVRKICSKAGLNKRVMLEATKIIRLAQRNKITSGSPVSLAAASVYYASTLLGIDVTRRDIGLAADVTEVTVWNWYKALKEGLKLEETLPLEIR
jgi:transcription initiation factor TFIIB